jgi:hypothetical protein
MKQDRSKSINLASIFTGSIKHDDSCQGLPSVPNGRMTAKMANSRIIYDLVIAATTGVVINKLVQDPHCTNCGDNTDVRLMIIEQDDFGVGKAWLCDNCNDLAVASAYPAERKTFGMALCSPGRVLKTVWDAIVKPRLR